MATILPPPVEKAVQKSPKNNMITKEREKKCVVFIITYRKYEYKMEKSHIIIIVNIQISNYIKF